MYQLYCPAINCVPLLGGRASVIEYQGGSKLHMDNPQHIAVVSKLLRFLFITWSISFIILS